MSLVDLEHFVLHLEKPYAREWTWKDVRNWAARDFSSVLELTEAGFCCHELAKFLLGESLKVQVYFEAVEGRVMYTEKNLMKFALMYTDDFQQIFDESEVYEGLFMLANMMLMVHSGIALAGMD